MGFSTALSMLIRFGPYAALALGLWYIYHQGQLSERAKLEIEAARAAITVLQQQRNIAEAASQAAQASAIERSARAEALEGLVERFKETLIIADNNREKLKQNHDETIEAFEQRLAAATRQNASVAACILSDADARSLRDIR